MDFFQDSGMYHDLKEDLRRYTVMKLLPNPVGNGSTFAFVLALTKPPQKKTNNLDFDGCLTQCKSHRKKTCNANGRGSKGHQKRC